MLIEGKQAEYGNNNKKLKKLRLFTDITIVMLFVAKKLVPIRSLFLLLVFSLGFQFSAYSNVNNAHNTQNQAKNNAENQVRAVENTLNDVQKLIKKYEIDIAKSETTDEESDTVVLDDEFYVVSKLKKDCKEEKEKATACCINPNACNGFALDIAQYVLPLAPSLLSAFESYNISSKASGGELTQQEAINKMCSAQNTVALGAFGTTLMNQLSPIFQKNCAKRIASCEEACNEDIDTFKSDFMKVYSTLFPNFKIVQQIVGFVKQKCFDIQNKLSEIEIAINNQANDRFSIDNGTTNECNFIFNSKDKSVRVTDNQTTSTFDQQGDIVIPMGNKGTDIMESILYVAKAYQNTTKDRKYQLTNNSTEEEIVKCGNQPDRVLDSSPKPGQPVSTPAIQICQQAFDHALNKSPSPPHIVDSGNKPNIGVNNFAGDRTNQNPTNTLSIPEGEDCEYGVLSAESLENCPIGLADEDFNLNNKPSLAKGPQWADSNAGGGSPGPGGGGGGIPSSGSLAGNTPSVGGPRSYPSYRGPADLNAGFGNNPAYPPSYRNERGGMGLPNNRLPSDDPKAKMPLNNGNMPFPMDENSNEKSIFQLASDRIQNFCMDYSCDNK
ncbi:MAG: hypothetical protein OXC37_05880 [Bdellovibrionaceae bacterium]|nr:hypothetical protein [Pseudobdellovibrionaceae bacterium]